MAIKFNDGSEMSSGPQVLETFDSPCDGATIQLAGNRSVTMENVTTDYALSTSYADIPGSSINYTPPSGTLQVIYRFQFHIGRGSDKPICHVKFFVDGNWCSHARFTEYSNGSSLVQFRWGVNIGGSTTHATGRLGSWTSSKNLKLQAREWGSDHQVQMHETQHWDGGGDEFVQPLLGITAIGT